MLIIILILIILATSAFGIFAWARYQTSVQGEGTAQVAQWNFKVTGDTTQTEQVVFAVTRTDGNTTVAEGMLAPGTSGKIEMAVDVTGTQTDLIYTISGSTVNMPRNLKLYTDEAMTEEILVVGQQFSKGNYLTIADIGTETKIIPETIYWAWPFETGVTDEDKLRNNQIDTEDMGKAMTMALTVEGKQLNGAPVLADLVQVGDYVNYDASSNGVYNITPEDCADLAGVTVSNTISTDVAFNYDKEQPAPVSQWRVLSVNRETKEVELMSVDTTVSNVQLKNIDGFVNASEVLNRISAIYGHGKGAIEARSINGEDIDKYSSYDKNTFRNREGYPLGETKSYTFKVPGNPEQDLPASEVKKLTGVEANPTESTQSTYTYSKASYFTNSVIYNMLFRNASNTEKDKSYWADMQCVGVYDAESSFGIREIYDKDVNAHGLYVTSGKEFYRRDYVVPVVKLNTNIQTTGQDANGVWQLKVE